MKYKIALLGVVALAIYAGTYAFKSGESSSAQINKSGVIKVSSQEVDKLIEDNNTFVLDVHTPEQSHIVGTDAFIPFDLLAENSNKLPEDKDTPILVYCRSGGMSNTASQELAGMGYTKVYDLVGGINEYRESHAGVLITPGEVDLGKVIYEEGSETEFVVTNNTSSPLKIKKVSGSCACTQPTIEKSELEPYESTKVKVVFEPSIHKDESDMGELVRSVFIDTDNINFKHLSFKISANVVSGKEK